MMNGNNNRGFWWNECTDDMSIEELEEFVVALEELKKKVNMRADELSMLNGSSLPSNQAVDYCASVVPYDFNYQGDGQYLAGKSSSSSSSVSDHQSNFVQQNNEYYSQICKELEAEKKKKEIIDESKMMNGNNNRGFWWNECTDDMSIEELEEFVVALEELKKKVNMRADELSMLNGSSLPSNQAVDYCASVVPYNFNYQGDGQF
ncbi:hypothetical protein K7X08_026669 [Anisodus acutangulus]|uniref:Uncharacterized protein n=1 Tax=Anisodus acutangulus TaxID=402998 RepID=A0A9Q1QW52_9SOLA|nr:hypothetical protein K7X08_026669 [Anisodus acutangulus]